MTMKKYLFLILLMLVGACTTFTFTSCGDDDDTESAYNMILGSWQENDTSDVILVLTFGKGGKGISQISYGNTSYSSEFTYDFDGRTLVVSSEEGAETYVVTFHDNIMTLSFQEDGTTYTETYTRVN